MSDAEQRAEIQRLCRSLRKLLHSAPSVDELWNLQEVGAIESKARKASGKELAAIRATLHQLMGRFKDAGIITPERWQEFFGYAD